MHLRSSLGQEHQDGQTVQKNQEVQEHQLNQNLKVILSNHPEKNMIN